eukprot:8865420-Pyramimonas_sp.AAC.1
MATCVSVSTVVSRTRVTTRPPSSARRHTTQASHVRRTPPRGIGSKPRLTRFTPSAHPLVGFASRRRAAPVVHAKKEEEEEVNSGRGKNPNEDMYGVEFKLDGLNSGLLVFAFIAFQFFVLAFVDFGSLPF